MSAEGAASAAVVDSIIRVGGEGHGSEAIEGARNDNLSGAITSAAQSFDSVYGDPAGEGLVPVGGGGDYFLLWAPAVTLVAVLLLLVASMTLAPHWLEKEEKEDAKRTSLEVQLAQVEA